MKITICSSLAFVKEIKETSDNLIKLNHEVLLPKTAELIIKGELTQEQIDKEKGTEAFSNRIIKNDAIKVHCSKIKSSDAILVLNYDKNNVKNYIGGAVFLELGFAYIFDKKIFLLNDIPGISYKDEITAMSPIVLNGDLSKIK